MNTFAILLLAAGSSSRMRGGDKQLEIVENHPLIRRLTEFAIQTGARVLITLPAQNAARAIAIDGLEAQRVMIDHPELGMGHSIACGVANLGDNIRSVMILPTDLPELTPIHFEKMMTAYDQNPDQIHRARSANGKLGHPVIFPARYFAELSKMDGDTGAKHLLQSEPIIFVDFLDHASTTDLDTPEDWENWRQVKHNS